MITQKDIDDTYFQHFDLKTKKPKSHTADKWDVIKKYFDVKGKTFADFGCDKGWYCWKASGLGALEAHGCDRPCPSLKIAQELWRGTQGVWFYDKLELGSTYDLVLCLSVYHYLYMDNPNHQEIVKDLASHIIETLIIEFPTENDSVVKRIKLKGYSKDKIVHELQRYFTKIEFIGHPKYSKDREFWKCTK